MKNTLKEITNSMQMKHATESLITNEKKKSYYNYISRED